MLLLLAADCADVSACMLGTTQFVNACVERRGLSRVAVLRLCGPATHALPPYCDVPVELRDALGGHHHLLDGMWDPLFLLCTLQVYRYSSKWVADNAAKHLHILCAGGYEFDGGTEISPLNKEQIQRATDTALKAGYTSFVVSGVFSPVNSSQEEAAADIIQKHAAIHHAGKLLPSKQYDFFVAYVN